MVAALAFFSARVLAGFSEAAGAVLVAAGTVVSFAGTCVSVVLPGLESTGREVCLEDFFTVSVAFFAGALAFLPAVKAGGGDIGTTGRGRDESDTNTSQAGVP